MARFWKRALGLAALTGAVTGTALGDEPAAQPKGTGAHKVRVRLLSERPVVVPGETIDVGLEFTIAPGWHLYWNGQSDTGSPPEVDWQLPAGAKAEPMLWPTPKRHASEGDLLDYIYEDRVTLLAPIKIPDGVKPGETFTVRGKVGYLVCRDVCIGEDAEVSLSLPVQDGSRFGPGPAEVNAFTAARKALPQPLPTDGSVRIDASGKTLRVKAAGAQRIAVYPGPESLPLADALKEGEAKGAELRAKLGEPLDDAAAKQATKEPRFRGVVEIWSGEGRSASYAVDVPVPPAAAPSVAPK